MKLLPPPSVDKLGRPIILLRVSDSLPDAETLREQVLWWMDSLRMHLRKLNAEGTHPVLQYAVIVDVAGVSMRHLVSAMTSQGASG